MNAIRWSYLSWRQWLFLGTLRDMDSAAALTVARNLAPERASVILTAQLVAIIDRLSGITATGGEL